MRNHLKNYDYKDSLYEKRSGFLVEHTGFFFSYIFQSEINKTNLKHFIISNVITPGVLRSPAMFIRSLFNYFRYALNYFKKSFKQHCYSYADALSFYRTYDNINLMHIIKHTIMNRGYATAKDVTGGLLFGCFGAEVKKPLLIF